MPHDNHQRLTQTTGTIALLGASVLLAVTGIALLVHRSPTATSIPLADPSRPSRTASAKPSNSPVAAPQAPHTEALSPSEPEQHSPAADPDDLASVPDDVAFVAREFVLAWASHDARPGMDTTYSAAAQRAARYADPNLAQQLSNTPTSTAHQWQQWTKEKARVSVDITKLAVPDGAPAPSAGTAWIRVRYRLTVTPAAGHPSASDEQVALKLQHSARSHWLVTALPYA